MNKGETKEEKLEQERREIELGQKVIKDKVRILNENGDVVETRELTLRPERLSSGAEEKLQNRIRPTQFTEIDYSKWDSKDPTQGDHPPIKNVRTDEMIKVTDEVKREVAKIVWGLRKQDSNTIAAVDLLRIKETSDKYDFLRTEKMAKSLRDAKKKLEEKKRKI